MSLGPCPGDAGGPIMEWDKDHWNQVGIVSYTPFGCLTADHQPIYTRLSAYYNWMQSIVQKTNHSLSHAAPLAPTPGPPIVYRCDQESVQCGCGLDTVTLNMRRIVGGHEAVPYSWSMIVSLRFDGSTDHSCGGSILNDNYILSAAHCFKGISYDAPAGVSIAAGIHNRSEGNQTIRQVDRIIIHPGWDAIRGHQNDIAILHLSQPLNIANNHKLYSTCVPHLDSTQPLLQYPRNGTQLVVIGWGDLADSSFNLPAELQQAEVFNIDNSDPTCLGLMEDPELQFCAGLYAGGKGKINEASVF